MFIRSFEHLHSYIKETKSEQKNDNKPRVGGGRDFFVNHYIHEKKISRLFYFLYKGILLSYSPNKKNVTALSEWKKAKQLHKEA